MTKNTPKPRRLWRKALLGLGAVLLVLVVLVAAAPTLINLGVGRGAVVGALERRVNGTVALDRLDLGWFGPQSASGLTVTGTDGTTTAKLDLGINAGLLGLITGRTGALAVDVSGALKGELRADGSTSFGDLVARKDPGAGRGTKPPARDKARPMLAGVPPTSVRVDGVSLELKEAGKDLTVNLGDLTGALDYEPGGPVTCQLAGTTAGGSAPGSLTISGRGDNVFDRRGALTPKGAVVKVDVAVERLPLLLSERPTELTAMQLTADSNDLAERLSLKVGADAAVDGAAAGRLDAELAVAQPVQPDGTLSLDLGRLSGHVTGKRVPAALLQTAFARTPIVISRDIGPSLDIDARFAGAGTGDVTVSVVADAARLEFAGAVDPQRRSIAGRTFKIAATAHPDLVADLTRLYIDRPAGVEIDIDSLAIPPTGDKPGSQLAGLAVGGTLKVTTPATVARESGGAALFTLSNLMARLDAPVLRDGFTMKGSATVDGAEAMFDHTVSGYMADDGSFDFAGVVPLGTVSLQGVTGATLARFAPEQGALLEAALTEPINVTLNTRIEQGELTAALTAGGEGQYAGLVAKRRGDTVRVGDGRATLTVSPELAALLQKDATRPIRLLEPAQVTVEIDPFTLPAGGGLPTTPLTARVDVEDLKLEDVPGLAEPIAARKVFATITAEGGEALAVSVDGRARLRRVTQTRLLANLTLAVEAVRREKKLTVPRVELGLSDIAVKQVDQLLGNQAGKLLTWVGETGKADLTFRSDAGAAQASIAADFPRLSGEFNAAADGDVLRVTSGGASVSLSKEAIQQRLSPPPGGGQPAPTGVTVEADVPMNLRVIALDLPRALLDGEPFDPAAVNVDLVLSGGPVKLNDPQQGRSSIDDLKIALRSTDLAEGVNLSVTGQVKAAGAPGTLDVQGQFTGLVTEGALTPDNAQLAMNANAKGVHSAVVDALAGWKGLLVAAVGPRLDLTATAQRFSRNTGFLQARIDSTNGWLEIPRAMGRDNALKIRGGEDREASAELEITPPLRQRLLAPIHPLLADIRTTEQPLRATLGGTVVPFDGDVSRLRADLDLTIGAVEFDSGSVTLALLLLFNAANVTTIPGEIEPIKAKVRDGVVTYDRFAVRIDQYELVYSGKINLKNRMVDLRTEIPLAALAHAFKELEGYADKIVVPLVTRGRLGELTKDDTKIDPDFDMGKAALEAGVGGLLQDVSEDTGVPVGDLLKDILNPKKKQ